MKKKSKNIFLPVFLTIIISLILVQIDYVQGCLSKFFPISDFNITEETINKIREEAKEKKSKEDEEIKVIGFDPLNDPANEFEIPETHQLNVPFTSQAPFQNWSHPFDEACEETSLLMVHYYYEDLQFDPTIATTEILDFTTWQAERGYKVDISIFEAGENARGYFGRNYKVYTEEDINLENLKKLIALDYPVIIPVAGQLLNNPNFQNGGPPYHMLVLTGYDQTGFFTNDPGTRVGHNYYYSYHTILNSIHDWTGSKATIQSGGKNILVLEK